ncbi:MAG: hypothetical protein JXJ04_06195, partial [Spirochaetales bacterium]|nr:hypothetical protein [Spirochaetales bacterium]
FGVAGQPQLIGSIIFNFTLDNEQDSFIVKSMRISIAIIGLGRVGSILLQELLKYEQKGVEIAAVEEPAETPGKILAKSKGIKIMSMEEICLLGESVDIIFELTGSEEVRRSLRGILGAKKNQHTVIGSETIASLICLILTDKELPLFHEHTGY